MAALRQKSVPVVGFSLALASAIFLSAKAVFVKLGYRDTEISPVALLVLRMAFSLPFYVGLAFVSGRGRRAGGSGLRRRDWVTVIFLGLCGYYLSSLLDFLGLQYIPAGLERVILFLYPTFVVLINSLYYKQRIGARARWALVLCYLGVVVCYLGEMHFTNAGAHYLLGCLLVLGCACTFAVYLVGTGRVVSRFGASRFTAYAMFSATGGVFLHYILFSPHRGFHLTPHLAWLVLLLAVVSTVLPSLLSSAAIQMIGSSSVSIISCVGPVSTILLAHWFLGEPIFLTQMVGTGLIIGGVLLMGRRQAGAGGPTPAVEGSEA